MYINTFGVIPVKIKLFKGDKEIIINEDLSGEYEDLEVESVEEAISEIKNNIEHYFDCMSSQKYFSESGNKNSYVSHFSEAFNINFDEVYDLKIEVLEIDTSFIKIDIEEE